MSRDIRRMKRNDTSAGLPRHIVFFDTETVMEGTRAKLQFGWGEEWVDPHHGQGFPNLRQRSSILFHTTDQFWDWIEGLTQDKRVLYVMAHNLGGFDFPVVQGFMQLGTRGWKAEKVIMGPPPFFIRLRKDGSTIVLLDSLNYYRQSLKVVGEGIGISKGEDPGELSPLEERLDYCRLDVRILREAMFAYFRFVHQEDLGTFALTLAGQSMNAWRHRFMPDLPILINHTPTVAALERRAYSGGAVLEFRRGRFKGIGKVDKNSMFPGVMRKEKFPYAMIHRARQGSLDLIARTRRQGYGHVAEVWIRTDEPWYPLKHDGRLEFPVGEFCSVLCGPELYRAIDSGHVTRVGEVQIYKMGDLFSRYVDHFYNKRLEFAAAGNLAFAHLCKIFMNSLYGKFGQRTPAWKDAPGKEVISDEDTCLYDHRTGRILERRRRVLGHVEQRDTELGEAYYAMCAIAAYVTAYARTELRDGILTAGPENALYCDTDSMLLTPEGMERLRSSGQVHQKQLGMWKVECESADLEVRALKDYTYGGDVKIKGIRAHAQTTVKVSENVYEQDMFVSSVGAIRRGHPDEMHIIRVRKELQRACRKGVLTSEGKVIPRKFTFGPTGNVPNVLMTLPNGITAPTAEQTSLPLTL